MRIGVDLGGTKIEAVALDEGGAMLTRLRVPTPRDDYPATVEAIAGLVEALEEGRVEPNSWLLMPAFGGGLTYCSLLVKWGDRVTPIGTSDAELPPNDKTALELVNEVRARQDPYGRSKDGLLAPVFPEVWSAAGE